MKTKLLASLPRNRFVPLSALTILMLLVSIFPPQFSASAAPTLSVTPITWNVIGLDSNNPSVGPNRFPVGARVCNTGDATATNVVSSFVWITTDTYINLRPGSLSEYTILNNRAIPSLAAGACTDFYYEVEITRSSLAYNHTARYSITASADSPVGTVSSATPREIFVEHLISQSRNSTTEVKLNGVVIPAGGPMTLLLNNTYQIDLVGKTATNGYNQIETFINFPNTIFQILSVSTLYSADSSLPPTGYVPNPNSKLYGDGCLWDNDPDSPTYRSCTGIDGKAGGDITVTYQIKVIGGGGTNQTLSNLIYDFSGSSYHYNADFAAQFRIAAIVDPNAVNIAKTFTPRTTSPGGTSKLAITLTNPNSITLTGVQFNDPLLTPNGQLKVATTVGASTNGCGSPTFAPLAGDTSLSFTNGTLAPNSTCVVEVSVVTPSGTTISTDYVNTTGSLKYLLNGSIYDTGKTAKATLTADNNSIPQPPPLSCKNLVVWTVPTGSANPPAFDAGTKQGDVSVATAGVGSKVVSAVDTGAGNVAAPSWQGKGFVKPTTEDTAAYMAFTVDTSQYTDIRWSFNLTHNSKGPTYFKYYASTTLTAPYNGLLGSDNIPSSDITWHANSFTIPGTGASANPVYFIVTGYGAFNGGNDNTANLDDIYFYGCQKVPPPPTITKAFSPNPVAVNGISTLTFTVRNLQAGNMALTGVSFTDTLPDGLVINSAPATPQCGGAVSSTAGSITLTGGTLAAGATCNITASIKATTAGPHQNVSGFITASQSGANTGSSGFATASLTALLAPVIDKSFAPDAIFDTQNSTLTFTITNPNPSGTGNDLTGIAFSDTYPSNIINDNQTTYPVTNTCGGTITAATGGNSISLGGAGGTLAGGGSCTITVKVKASALVAIPITYNNTSGAVTADITGGTDTAAAVLSVRHLTPAISLLKRVGPSNTGPWATFLSLNSPLPKNVYFQFTVENTGDTTLSNVSITDVTIPGLDLSNCSSVLSGGLALYETKTCVSGAVSVTTADSYSNTAYATGDSARSPDSKAKYSTTGLTLTKTVTETSFLATGDILHYSYIVANSGYFPLLGPVLVTDNKVTVNCPSVNSVGDFDNYLDPANYPTPGIPAESLTCTATYTISAADVSTGTVTNIASATAGGVTSNTDTKTVNALPRNFGHLPAAYAGMNLLADGGAWALTGTSYLGASVTTASDGINTINYTPKVSDDGVTWTGNWNSGTGYATVNVTCPSGNCYLYAWADWNNDHLFTGVNEAIYAGTVNAGNNSISFTFPGGGNLASGTFYTRFRLYAQQPSSPQPSGGALTAGGTPIVGEIEDPIISSDGSGGTPTPVTLSYFQSNRQGSNVNFNWSTETETGNVGFNLYVKTGQKMVQINTQLIPSLVIDSLNRQDYTFTGKVGGNVFYIEDVSVLGETKLYGPFQIGQTYGARLTIETINQAAVQAEHTSKNSQHQGLLIQQITVPDSAHAPVVKPGKPTKSPVPTATVEPTQTPMPTATEILTSTPMATGTEKPPATATPTETPISTVEPTATLDSTITEEPLALPTDTIEPTATTEPSITETVIVEPTATSTETPVPTEFPTPTEVVIYTETSTPTMTPTVTASPTATAEPYAAAMAFDPASLQLVTTFNLKVRQTGIYRVTYEMLQNAGLDLSGVSANQITVINRNLMIPVFIYVPNQAEIFGSGSYIEFYGEALDTLYTDTNIYTVQVSSASVPRISAMVSDPGTSLESPISYTNTMVVNRQRTYANSSPSKDPWYDTAMMAYTASKSWNYTFQVNGLADPTVPTSLDLVVWGMTSLSQNPDHHLKVALNGNSVANTSFDGLVEQTLKINLPAGVLREGTNTLQLTLPGDTGASYDIVYLDKYSVTYPSLFKAQSGRLTFTASGDVIKVSNLTSSNVVVYRMRNGGLARLENLVVQAAGSTFTATFAGTDQADTYLVTTLEAMNAPTLEAVRVTADLNHPAQYLIISNPDFISGMQPLVAARQAQGLTVSVVDVNDLYARYTYGIFDPQAIKKYIAYAAQNLGTQYVLLVGGDTYDYRNYLGKNSISFIPSLYITTGPSVNFVPADPLYADLNGDNVPDLAIGRFPVRNSAELAMVINKTLAYSGKNYGRTATFVSDLNDGIVNYKNLSSSLSAGLPFGWTVENIPLDNVSVATARTNLLAAMNRGTALITYTGHSGPSSWSTSNVFNTTDASTLQNAGKPFVVVQWGCWNTYAVDPVNNFLVQTFLVWGNRGAAAVMGASTLVDSGSEQMLGVLLTPRLTIPGMSIGQAVRDAKLALAATHPELQDVLLGWSLMGDPALVVEP